MMGERDQLYALFAETLGYLPVEEVLSLAEAWEGGRAGPGPFRDALATAGHLGPEALLLVDALVADAVGRSRDDAALALTSLPPSLRDRLARVSVTVRSDPGRHVDELLAEANAGSTSRPGEAGARDARFIPLEVPGRYRTDVGQGGREEELGRGGSGRVVLAHDAQLGREVALKELLPQYAAVQRHGSAQSLRIEESFLREARVTGQLEHPAVVPVYDLLRRPDGTLAYTMQRVRGRTLSQALADAGSLRARIAFLPDLLVVSRAVAAAHHRGIVHRDLKPQNVMLGAFGATFLMDWGLAAPPERARHAPPGHAAAAQAPVGTPSYMSPEQAGGGTTAPIDEQSDVWGLGAMLFELLTGRAPFVGSSVFEVLAQVRSGPEPDPAQLEPNAPPELLAICRAALRRDRAQRYRTARAFADDLVAFLDDTRVSVYRASTRQLVTRIARRHRAAAIAVSLGLVVLSVSGVAGLAQLRRERDEARQFAELALDELSGSLEDAPGAGAVVDQLMRSSLETYGRSVDPARSPRADVLRLTRALWRLGFAAWQQQRLPEALAAYERARTVADALRARLPQDTEAAGQALRARVGLADVRVASGRAAEGLDALRQLRPEAEALVESAPSSLDALDTLALVRSREAMTLVNLGQPTEALAVMDHLVRVRERRVALAPLDGTGQEKLGFDLAVRGMALLELGRLDEARTSLEQARAAADAAFRAQGTRRSRATRGTVSQDLARLELEAGHLEAMQAVEREALADFEAALETDPEHVVNRWLAAEAALLLGDPARAWGHAQHLVGHADYDGFVAVVALAAGRQAEALTAATGGEAFAAEQGFARATLALLAGRRDAAANALEAIAAPGVDLTLFAPYALANAQPELPGPAGAEVRRWSAALLAAPRGSDRGQLRATLHRLAAEVRADGGVP